MTKTFTQNDVIRYVYGEIKSEQEQNEIENALILDNDLAEFFYEASSLKENVSGASMEPSNKAIENILNYSKTFTLQVV